MEQQSLSPPPKPQELPQLPPPQKARISRIQIMLLLPQPECLSQPQLGLSQPQLGLSQPHPPPQLVATKSLMFDSSKEVYLQYIL